jgi:uncharacterized damage-inducible protein DinB
MTTMNGATMTPEFDHEFAQTRRTLERIPEDKFDWKPHEKSFSLHELSAHIAEIAQWVPVALNMDEFDMDASHERFVPETKEQLLQHFDEGVAAARPVLEAATAENLMTTWSMKKDGEVVFSMPKIAVIRNFILNHNVHHRAQLGVYLRMLDVPVPAIYGPSADEEPPMG